MGSINLSDFDYVFNEFDQLQDFMSSVEHNDFASQSHPGLQFLPNKKLDDLLPSNSTSLPMAPTSTLQSSSDILGQPQQQQQSPEQSTQQQQQQQAQQQHQQPQQQHFQYPQQPFDQFGTIVSQGPQVQQPFIANGQAQMAPLQQAGIQVPAMISQIGQAQQLLPAQMLYPTGYWPGLVPNQSLVSAQQQSLSQQQQPQQQGLQQQQQQQQLLGQHNQLQDDERKVKRSSQKTSKEQKNQSHSTIEKIRRDRINSLIDELRDLVPATGEFSEQSEKHRFKQSIGLEKPGQPDTRPKHVVLKDTVDMLRQLLEQAKLSADNGQHSEPNMPGRRAVSSSLHEAASVEPSGSREVDSAILRGEAKAIFEGDYQFHQQEDPTPESSSLSKHDSTSIEKLHVTVDESDESMFVRVQCGDRKGLLSDIIEVLKVLPLQIKTAAITTGVDSKVHDVFEVRRDASSDLTAAHIQQHIVQRLRMSHAMHAGDKRRRMLDNIKREAAE